MGNDSYADNDQGMSKVERENMEESIKNIKEQFMDRDAFDKINMPQHYTYGKIQPWDVVDDWDMDHYTASALHYMCRHMRKGTPIEDIEKAIAHLRRRVEVLKKKINHSQVN